MKYFYDRLLWIPDGVTSLLQPSGLSHIVVCHVDSNREKNAMPIVACGLLTINMNWTSHPQPPTLRVCKKCEKQYQKFKEDWMANQTTHEATFECGGCDIIKTKFRDGSVRWGIAPHEKDGKGHVIVAVAHKVGEKLRGPYNTTKVTQRWRKAVDAWIEFCNSGRV